MPALALLPALIPGTVRNREAGFGVEAEQESEGWLPSGQCASVAGLLAATVLSCARTSSFVLWVGVRSFPRLPVTSCYLRQQSPANVATVLFL